MSITCEVCGTVNPTGTQFCEGCGVELKASSASQPDLGPPTIPPAPSVPDAPVIPAPALDSQASVPNGLEAPADSAAGEMASETQASGVQAGEVQTAPSSTEIGTPAAPAVNPDMTSTADAPLDDTASLNEAVSANAPAMTPAVDSTVSAPEMTTPEMMTDATGTQMTGTQMTGTQMAGTQMAGTEMTGTEEMGTGGMGAEGIGAEGIGAETSAAAAAPTPADSGASRTGEAKLGVKKFGNATGDFIPLQGERLMVGRFDASSGPVDIDLSSLPGAEHISRHHAELYREGGQWFVRDLGSTNGVFIRRGGQSAFSPRLQEPAALTNGDELAFGNLMLTFHQD